MTSNTAHTCPLIENLSGVLRELLSEEAIRNATSSGSAVQSRSLQDALWKETPSVLLRVLEGEDTHYSYLCPEARFASVLFNPRLDYLPLNTRLGYEIRRIASSLHEELLADSPIRVPYTAWHAVFGLWYDGAVTFNCQFDAQYGLGLMQVNEFSRSCEHSDKSGTISGGEYNRHLTDLMEWIGQQATLELPLTLRRLAHYLLTGYVPRRLLV